MRCRVQRSFPAPSNHAALTTPRRQPVGQASHRTSSCVPGASRMPGGRGISVCCGRSDQDGQQLRLTPCKRGTARPRCLACLWPLGPLRTRFASADYNTFSGLAANTLASVTKQTVTGCSKIPSTLQLHEHAATLLAVHCALSTFSSARTGCLFETFAYIFCKWPHALPGPDAARARSVAGVARVTP